MVGCNSTIMHVNIYSLIDVHVAGNGRMDIFVV